MKNLDLPPDGLSTPADGETAALRPPTVGDLGYDSRSDRVGVVMEVKQTFALLRPCGGGREWDVPLSCLHPAGHADELRARVAELNAASRWGL